MSRQSNQRETTRLEDCKAHQGQYAASCRLLAHARRMLIGASILKHLYALIGKVRI